MRKTHAPYMSLENITPDKGLSPLVEVFFFTSPGFLLAPARHNLGVGGRIASMPS